MKFFLSISILFCLNAFSQEIRWSKETTPLSENKAQQILEAYKNKKEIDIKLEDDFSQKEETYTFKENIFLFGLEVGVNSNSEKIYNKVSEKTSEYSSKRLKLLFAKDFTLWHEEYTQPSRLYGSFSYSFLDSNVKYTTFSMGLKENMFYWSIYKRDNFNLYPTFYLELGSSSITRETFTSSGFTKEGGIGIALSHGHNFEYYIDISSKSINWDHPIDGIADEMSSYGVSIGINYKIMYGDI